MIASKGIANALDADTVFLHGRIEMSLKTAYKKSVVKIENIPSTQKAPRRAELEDMVATLKKSPGVAICREYQKRIFAYNECQSFQSAAALFEIPITVAVRGPKLYFLLKK